MNTLKSYMRLEQLEKILKKSGKLPYLVSNLTNIYYLTGFEGSYGHLLISKDRIVFITDSRYTEYTKSILPEHIEIREQKNDFPGLLRDFIKGRLFVEQLIPLAGFLNYKKQLKNIKILPANDEVGSLRIVKDEHELENLKKAVAIADSCFDHLLKIIKPGMTEWDIAVEVEYFYRKNGCRKSSFDTIIASGKGSSMPHYIPSMTKKIETKDILLIDMGCVFNGYNSDLSRTIFFGNISAEFKKIYGIVRKAQEEAISQVKPGIMTGRLDKIARDIIAKEGYGPAFGHSLGHGVGLEIHESPALKKGDKYRLKKNIPFTVEPGIYLPDKGGVRIEDVVIACENGCEILTKASKEIIIL
ncbi:MAG: Xaa-Pro peptidase family protein [Spirochaetota bacterium]